MKQFLIGMKQFWRDLKDIFNKENPVSLELIIIDLVGKSKVIVDYIRIINKYSK